MAKISLNDLKRVTFLDGITSFSSTLNDFIDAVNEIDKQVDSFGSVFSKKLDKLTKEDIKVLEKHFNKKFNARFLLKEYDEYVSKMEKKEDDFLTRGGGSRNSDNWFDHDFDYSRNPSRRDKGNYFDGFDEKKDLSVSDSISEKISLNDLKYDFLSTGFSVTLDDFLNFVQGDEYLSVSDFVSLMEKLSSKDIQHLEKGWNKKFDSGYLKKEYSKLISKNGKKLVGFFKKKSTSRDSDGFFDDVVFEHSTTTKTEANMMDFDYNGVSSEMRHSSSRESVNPFDDIDYTYDAETEEDLIVDAKSVTAIDDKMGNDVYGFSSEMNSSVSEMNQNSAKSIVADSYFSILEMIEKIYNKNIIDSFKEKLLDIRMVSSNEQFIIKSNDLINQTLLDFDIDQVGMINAIQNYFNINFSSDKAPSIIIAELGTFHPDSFHHIISIVIFL